MKEFEPSKDFTEMTMGKVRTYERELRRCSDKDKIMPNFSLRYLIASSGLIFGILNLLRLYLALFPQVACN